MDLLGRLRRNSDSTHLVQAFRWKEKILLPTVARTEAGFYLDREPVAVVNASDKISLIEAITDRLKARVETVPTPNRGDWPKWVVLQHAKVRSVNAFEKEARFWRIEKRGSHWIVEQWKHHEEGKGFVPGHETELTDAMSIQDVATRFAAVLQSPA